MNPVPPQLIHAQRQSAPRDRLGASAEDSTRSDRGTLSARAMFDQIAPFFEAPAYFGPPVIFVLGPWLLFVLLLLGPFAALLMVLLVLAIVAVLVAALAVAIAGPFLLVRRLRAPRAAHQERFARRHSFQKLRVSFGRSGSTQPKGMS